MFSWRTAIFAEMFASGGLVDTAAFPPDVGRIGRPERLEGLRLVEGVALGDAVLHQLRIEVSRLVAEDPEAEAARLEEAIGGLRASMDELLLLPEVKSIPPPAAPLMPLRQRAAATSPIGSSPRSIMA